MHRLRCFCIFEKMYVDTSCKLEVILLSSYSDWWVEGGSLTLLIGLFDIKP